MQRANGRKGVNPLPSRGSMLHLAGKACNGAWVRSWVMEVWQ